MVGEVGGEMMLHSDKRPGNQKLHCFGYGAPSTSTQDLGGGDGGERNRDGRVA